MEHSIQIYFETLRDNLSGRARNALNANKISDFSTLLKKIERPNFTFTRWKNCGKQTAAELDDFVSQLLNYKKKLEDGEVLTVESVFQKHTVFQKYFETLRSNLSVRARYILYKNKKSDFSTLLKELERPNFTFTRWKNCDKQTAAELDDFVSQLLNYKKELDGGRIVSSGNIFLNTPITDFDLSVRTINCLKHIDIETLGDLVAFERSDLINVRGFGGKALQEIEDVVYSYGLYFGMNVLAFPKENETIQDKNSFISTILCNPHLSDTDRYLSYAFKDKFGHFPMIFISYRVLSFLNVYEREVLRMSIEPSKPLSFDEIAIKICLTRERIRQIYDKAKKKLKTSETIKQLFRDGDWSVYGIYEDTPFVFSCNLHTDRIAEERNFIIEYAQNSKDEKWNTPLITDNSLYFILVIKGMTPLWVDPKKKELSTFYIETGETSPLLFVDDKLSQYKFNKAIKEVLRLQKVKKTENVFIPIICYFIDNDIYWNGKTEITSEDELKETLIRVLQVVCGVKIEGECIVFEYNMVDYGNLLYEILKRAGSRLHRDELLQLLLKECLEQEKPCEFTDSSQITAFLNKDARIIAIGKSGYWGLKEWNEITGSIRNIAIKMIKKSKMPIQIEDLAKEILWHRPDSALDNITTIIRQSVYIGELVLFFDDYIGLKGRKYDDKYVIYPSSFDEWVDQYRQFVTINKHHPYSGQGGYEGYLFRWHYKASQLIDLSSEEILKFDALEKELAHYPQNATEYNFLQNCNLYKKFVESNQRMLTKEDDTELFNWFYKYSRSYCYINDNRNKYFSQLLQYISQLLY